uniref:WAP domain-containing protein n=1 Tax=Gallus gallus TaxID=9031 RepID=A0A8V0YM38_CHICK
MASARPAPGCSLATTAESGAGVTPTASARRSAVCGAVTTCACVQPKVGATEHPPRASLVVPSHPQLCIFCLPEKPGICPLSEQAAGQCAEECESDAQCPQGERCTRMGCRPTGGCPMDGCPQVGVLQHMVAWGTCLDLCSFDEECPWGQKCCSNGCGHISCPAPAQHQVSVLSYHRARCRRCATARCRPVPRAV